MLSNPALVFCAGFVIITTALNNFLVDFEMIIWKNLLFFSICLSTGQNAFQCKHCRWWVSLYTYSNTNMSGLHSTSFITVARLASYRCFPCHHKYMSQIYENRYVTFKKPRCRSVLVRCRKLCLLCQKEEEDSACVCRAITPHTASPRRPSKLTLLLLLSSIQRSQSCSHKTVNLVLKQTEQSVALTY